MRPICYTITHALTDQLLMPPFAVPSQPPENVRALSITSDVAVISWSEPPRSTLNGVLKGYRVIFWSLYVDGGESSGINGWVQADRLAFLGICRKRG